MKDRLLAGLTALIITIFISVFDDKPAGRYDVLILYYLIYIADFKGHLLWLSTKLKKEDNEDS